MQKLQGGADLMTPGLAAGPPFPPKARKNVIVAIASTERPTVPVAMGVCEIDVSALDKVQGAKGHAVENMHWAGDELWSYSVASRPGQPPPEEIAGWGKVLAERGLIERTDALVLDDQDEGGGVPLEDSPPATGSGRIDEQQAEDDVSVKKDLSQKEIDDAFRNAFFYGVHSHKSSNPQAANHGLTFPLSQSMIMSALVQPFLPSFTPELNAQLQIKKHPGRTSKSSSKALTRRRS
jgi:translation initiation factor 2D